MFMGYRIIPLAEADDFRLKQKQKKDEITEQQKRNLDYTKYQFNGEGSFSKRRLVLKVIKQYIVDNPKITFEELHNLFPDQLQGSHGVFKKIEDIEDNRRYFVKNSISLNDGNEIVVCNQWSLNNWG